MNGDSGETDFRCELHLHSTYSDGFFAPEHLLRVAHERGLTTVAITDHDTAGGARAAIPVAAALGLDYIPAIEFTGRWDACARPDWGLDVDVLGYFVDLEHPLFRAQEQAAKADVEARIAACCVSLTRAGYPVAFDEVRALNAPYAGARHLRDVLTAKGYAAHYDASIKLFAAHWSQQRPPAFTIQQHIAVIQAAGGVAIMAHPHGIRCGDGLIERDRVAALVEMGVDGLEVYHRWTTGEAREHFRRLAEQFGLLVTGGSDEHGFDDTLPHMGTAPATREMVEALRQRHHERVAAANRASAT